ncbi:MAG: hypothetical protein Q8M19_24900 [Reyranella sp.]|nr:hypothetical protein [Reyranella sp.]
MKMNSAQIERTLHQLQAEAIPVEHPVMPQLERLFGEHTYFLDGNGLNIVEPVEAEKEKSNGQQGVVVNIASWTDASTASLEPHPPESTDLVIDLEIDRRH